MRQAQSSMTNRVLPTPSLESSSYLEVPPRPVRKIAAEAIADIDVAIEAFTSYGVKVKGDSRLHQARAILQHAAATGVLVPQHRGDSLGIRSLELAFDYGAIAATLPDTRIAAVRNELQQSLTGPIEPPEAALGPLQLQSQFVVRAAYVRGGVVPNHPKVGAGKTPDLVVRNGMSEYGIEAKRPQVPHNVIPRMEAARVQLESSGLRGAILVDVTDCTRHVERPDVDRIVREHALAMYDEIFVTGRGYRPDHDGIMVAGAYARLAWASDDRDPASMVSVHTTSTIGLFARRRNTLLDHHARWLRASFQDGLSMLSRTLAEREG